MSSYDYLDNACVYNSAVVNLGYHDSHIAEYYVAMWFLATVIEERNNC